MSKDAPVLDHAAIDHIFTYHPPSEEQQQHYMQLRIAASQFAKVLIDHTPPGADQQMALRKLRECVMTANAAVALAGGQ